MSENDIDEKHLPSRPPDANALLKLPPGVLNEGLDVDPSSPGAIGDEESGWSILQRVVGEVFNPSKLETQKLWKGVLMRVDNPYEEGAPYTPTDIALMASTPMKESTKYRLPTYKIRIPELHLPLPIPNNVYEPTAQDQLIIDQYPTVQAIDRFASRQTVSVGDVVWVEVPNSRASSSGLLYRGPVDPEGLGRGKSDGSSPVPQGACLEKCIQTYPNRGSIGDTVSREVLLDKPNSGLPPVVLGQGIVDDRIITGDVYKSWVVNLFKALKAEGKYKGLVWTGVCDNNGANDSLGMLSDAGRKVTEGKPGRSTVIYMPVGTDPTQPLEIIYWFHDNLGFRNNLKEWRDLWRASLSEMTKKKAQRLNGARRNFVFVVPEMPWSLEGSNIQTGAPRATAPSGAPAGSPEAYGYRDRQWTMWGFQGILKESFEHGGNILGACNENGALQSIISTTTNNTTEYFDDFPGGDAGFNPHGDTPSCSQQYLTPYSFPSQALDLPKLTFHNYWESTEVGEAVATNRLEHLIDPNADANMELFHEEVISILKKHFGAVSSNVQLTLAAEGRGGAAISNLARIIATDQEGKVLSDSTTTRTFKLDIGPLLKRHYRTYVSQLATLAPSKIVLINSDYSSVHYNFYHDNDIYQIAKGCNQANPPKIEIHLTPKSVATAPLPQRAASAFFGSLANVNAIDPSSPPTSFKDGIKRLKQFYSIWGHVGYSLTQPGACEEAPGASTNSVGSQMVMYDGATAALYSFSPEQAYASSRSIIYKGIGPKSMANKNAATIGIDQWSILPFHLQKNRMLENFYNAGAQMIRSEKNGTFVLPAPFQNITYKGWPAGAAKGAVGWLAAKHPLPTAPPVVHQITQTEQNKKSTIIASDSISSATKKVFENFNGKVILYSSELAGPSKTVAILQPHPAAAWSDYELIYYFHGDIGANGAAKTFKPALINQLNAITETETETNYQPAAGDHPLAGIWTGRNIIVVLVDIDPHPYSYSSKLWKDPEKPDVTFNKFHEEVVGKIKTNFAWCYFGAACIGVPYQPAKDPKFFTIKAHGGGSRMLKHAIKDLDAKYIGGSGGLRRIDFLDGNWGAEYGIINTIYNNSKWTSKVAPGTDFEIHIVASPQAFGPKKIPASIRAAKYLPGAENARPGVWVTLTNVSYGALPYKYFSAASKLDKGPEISNTAFFLAEKMGKVSWPNTLPAPGWSDSPGLEDATLLTFGKDGKAYAPAGSPYYGMHVPEFDLSSAPVFYKGKLENHTPSTEQVAQIRECDIECRQAKGTTAEPTVPSFLTNQDCKTNPLGLIEYATSQFSSIKIDPLTTGFDWGVEKLGDFLRGLDSGVWLKTAYVDSAGARYQRPTTWVVKDISPRQANGVDRVRGHRAHREGIEADIVLPQLNIDGLTPEPIGTPSLKRLTSKELDIDKTVALLILSNLNGARVVFLDKKFFGKIRARANFIATDGHGYGSELKMDKALKSFFRKHLFGKPNVVDQLMRLLQHKKGYDDRLKIRVHRKLALYEHSSHPRDAIKHLQDLGCDYVGGPA